MYIDLKTTEKAQILKAFAEQLESGGEYANMTLTRSGDAMRLVITTDVEPEPSAT
jgi:hypothetical protein